MEEAPGERTVLFAALSTSIQDLSLKLGNRNVSERERMKVKYADPSHSLVEGIHFVNESAKRAQKELGEFDKTDVHHTIIDPILLTWQDKVEYGKEAALYEKYELSDMRKIFEENFLYWTEAYFKGLPIAVTSNVPNILIKESVAT